ncbi:acyl-CoA thioesterase [Zhongshania sp.]|uniref:acyl-CoA thioesterase n=1 Tax=Zhongshania sp. TaxID=1971902 RepID=UPI0035646FA0
MRNKQFSVGVNECDDRGAIKNAVISDWFEVAAKGYLQECLVEFKHGNKTPEWQQQSLQFDYLHSGFAHSDVDLELSVTELARRSCTLGCRFYQAGKLMAVGSCVMVLVLARDGDVTVIPAATYDVLKSEMLGFLRIARS